MKAAETPCAVPALQPRFHTTASPISGAHRARRAIAKLMSAEVTHAGGRRCVRNEHLP